MTLSERDEGRARGAHDAPEHGAPEEERLRRVLQAAAARPDEVPSPSPFLGPRLRARIAEARESGAAPLPLATLGALAWRVVPALVVALALLGVWTGVERARAAQAVDEDASALLEPVEIVGEAPGENHSVSREEGP